MILFEKFGQHQPLNRQAERYAREGVDLSFSTLADQVGACAAALLLHALIAAHVMAAERLHGDDTTVPLLAPGKAATARLWSMSATTACSPAARLGRACYSASPATGVVSIPRRTWCSGTAPCRPRPTAASGSSITPTGSRSRSPRRCAGRMPGASSSSSLDIAATGSPRKGRPHRSRRSRSRRCGVSMPSSTSSAPSTARCRAPPRRPEGGGGAARRRARALDARRARAPLPPRPRRQGDEPHAQPPAELRPVPRGRT